MVSAGNGLREVGFDDRSDLVNLLLKSKDFSVIMVDTEARITNWNDGAENIYGYTNAELKSKSISVLYNSTLNESEQPWASLLLAKENGRHEHNGWHYRSNGSKFYANTLFSTIYNNENKIEGFLHVSRDITSLKKVEEDNKAQVEQLKKICVQQKKQLDTLTKGLNGTTLLPGATELENIYTEKARILESIGDGFFAIDENWVVTYWNTKAELLLGKKREDIIGKNLWEEYPDATGTKFYSCYQQAADQKIAMNFEEYYPGFDQWFKVNVYPSGNGLSIYFQDITDQKKAEKALKQSEARYRQIVETAQEGIWVIDEDCKTTFVNEKMCIILGYTQEEMLGKTSLYFKEEDCKDQKLKNLDGSKRAITEIYETTFITKSGKKIFAQVSTNPMLDVRGNYKGALAMVTDITDKVKLQNKVLEEQLQAQHQTLKAVVDAQERERAAIGAELHDNVNQLLATARLYINICLSKQSFQKESLLKSQEYVTESIEEIRKLSHALVGPTQDKIMGLIPSVKDLIFDISRAKQFKINFKYDTFREERNEVGLKLIIYRIIQEQVNNIVKHSNASIVDIELKKDGQDLSVSINDNGKGFDPAASAQGIGLNNIYNRAKLYNGSVEIDSSPGNGCRMKITFRNQGIGNGMRL